jgi:2-oxoglutarate ferredoxin oxidoreductase subunit alpha
MGYPVITAEAQERLVRRLCDKIRNQAPNIVRFEEDGTADAEIIVVAYGCASRSAREAVGTARAKGIRVGFLRLLTVWPFPDSRIRELAVDGVKGFVVPEVNYGQIAGEVERCSVGRDVLSVGVMGGAVHRPEMILEAIEEMN